MTEEQSRVKRESAMLVLGIVLGSMVGIIGNLWSAYFMEWYKSVSPNSNPNWTIQFIVSSVLLIAIVAYLYLWSAKRLKS